jgi:voltage-gated potassium channel
MGYARRLFIGGESSVKRTLIFRLFVVLLLFGSVFAIFLLDRNGLRDQIDGHVSIPDVIYFTMITVMTVGYGDIVPVTTQARLIDALFVTPVRLFIWLIFVGTAYQLVIQRFLEDVRMRIMQSRLEHHTLICGFGHSGRSAADELIERGTPPRQILVIDSSQSAVEAAARLGCIGLLGDATQESVLTEAMVQTAKAVLVCMDRDDTTVLTVLTIRSLTSSVRVVASVQESENEKLVRQSGANAIVLPSKVGGILMAESAGGTGLPEYIIDLITANGRVMLIEREARAEEVGTRPGDIRDGLLVRICRGTRSIGFWEHGITVEAGDKLVMIRPNDGHPPARM